MKRSLVVAAAAGAGALLSVAPASAQTGVFPAVEQAAPVVACYEFPIGAPGGCDFFQNVLQLLSIGSSSLSAGTQAS
ncbi:MAG TPA: hypothetical protein VK083_13175 [Nocardia sp.]|uniref:hypothetical protein n=1 Tax=Nocardia TaxID=1817 RepID=UPI0024558E81|nr:MULTISPECIES: hypothetical protein [Nocardia]HLS77732.1 hypothetical protein [Nocardia sp.]